MSDDQKAGKTPVQAMGRKDRQTHDDGVGTTATHGRDPAGESGGGAYPNPDDGSRASHSAKSKLGHGGQSQIAYHGTGQLGETDVEGQENKNSATGHN